MPEGMSPGNIIAGFEWRYGYGKNTAPTQLAFYGCLRTYKYQHTYERGAVGRWPVNNLLCSLLMKHSNLITPQAAYAIFWIRLLLKCYQYS